MANPIQLTNVLGNDNNKGLTAEHVLHMESSTALLLAEVWRDCDESGDEELSINELALDDSSPSPNKAPYLQLTNVWCDVDNNVNDKELSNIYKTPTAPADTQLAHLQLADIWCDVNEDESSVDKSIVPPQPEEHRIQPALNLATLWRDCDDEMILYLKLAFTEAEQTAQAPALFLAEIWRNNDEVSGDDISEEALAPHLADTRDSVDTQMSTSACVYGPDDFTFLEDNMFNDELSEEEKH